MSCATDSSARTTVVPAAITRPPRRRTAARARRCARTRRSTPGYGGSWRSGEETPQCSVIGRDPDATRHQFGDQLGCERPPGARHLGATGRARVHVLVGLERPASGHVAVADRLAVTRQVLLDAPPAASKRASISRVPSRVGRDQLEPRLPGQLQPLAGAASGRPRAVGASELNHPPARRRAGGPRGEVHSGGRTVGAPAPFRRRAALPETFTTSTSPGSRSLGQLREASVRDRAGRSPCHQQHEPRRGAGRAPRAARAPRALSAARRRARSRRYLASRASSRAT